MPKSAKTIPKFPEFVDILGMPWKILVLRRDQDPSFDRDHADGLCRPHEKTILVMDTRSAKNYAEESQEFHNDYMKEILRHEIVHAFLFESGLGSSTSMLRIPWAENEEMVDWFANQGQKIFKAWEECGCLRVMPPERWMEIQTSKKEGAKK